MCNETNQKTVQTTHLIVIVLKVAVIEVIHVLILQRLASEKVNGVRDDAVLEVLANLVVELETLIKPVRVSGKSGQDCMFVSSSPVTYRSWALSCITHSSRSASSSSISPFFGGLGGEKKLKNDSTGTERLTVRVWLVFLLRCFLVSIL